MNKVIFINSKDHSIDYAKLAKGNEAICTKIGYGCTLTELVSIEFNNDGLFCDDEGVFDGHSVDGDNHFGFLWCVSKVKGTFQKYFLICGNALIIGCNEKGEPQNVLTSLRDVEKRVIFLSSKLVKEYKDKLS